MNERKGSAAALRRAGSSQQMRTLFTRHKRVWEGIAAGAVLAATLGILMYYIIGPSVSVFHADCTDSLLWSQIMVETGEILSKEFSYAALLPFGSPLWMVPILRIWGYTMKAQIISMAVFALLFVLSAYSLFRAMKWRAPVSALGTFVLSMLLSGSAKLRELLWGHVIYYSLSILFVMLLLNVVLRLYSCFEQTAQGTHRVPKVIYTVLLFLLCVGCATDGAQVLAVSVLPVMGALLATAVTDGENRLLSRESCRRYRLFVLMGIGVCVGLGVLYIITDGGAITAGYENAYSNWSAADKWQENAGKLLSHYLTLFGVSVWGGEPLFSLNSVFVMLRLMCALLLLICPLLLLLRYRKIRRESSKVVLWTHLMLSTVILLGFICGSLSGVNWRLTPLLGSSILATFAYLRELWGSSPVGKRMGVLLSALLVSVSLLNGVSMARMSPDAGSNQAIITLGETLEEKGYTYGYGTFWNSHNITLLTDGGVTVVDVSISEGTVEKRHYQTSPRWYEDREGQETYFLLLTPGEYRSVIGGEYWHALTQRRTVVDKFQCEGYHVVVFDGNIFTD